MVQDMGKRSNMISLSDMLLKEKDEYLQKETARMLSVKEKDLEKADKTWRPLLLEMCRHKGINYENLSLPSQLASSRRLDVLCQRQRIPIHANSMT